MQDRPPEASSQSAHSILEQPADIAAGKNTPPTLTVSDSLALDRAVLDHFPVPVAVVGVDGSLIAANPAFSQAVGLRLPGEIKLVPALVDSLTEAIAQEQRVLCGVPGPNDTEILDVLALPLAAPSEHALLFVTEATVEINMRNALIASRARYMDIVALSGEAAWEIGADGRFTFVTANGLVGYSPRQLIGMDPTNLLDPSRVSPAVMPFLTPVALSGAEIWLKDADGATVCYEISAVPLYGAGDQWCGARGICRDVSEDRRNRAFLAEHRNNERLLARITEIFRQEREPEDMLMSAAEACRHGMTASGCEIVGVVARTNKVKSLAMVGACGDGSTPDPWLPPTISGDLDPRGSPDSEILAKDDWSLLGAQTIYRGRRLGALLLWRDPSQPAWTVVEEQLVRSLAGQLATAMDERAEYARLRTDAHTDPLTNLLNRRAFDEELQRRLRRLAYDRHCGALLYVDLNNFKAVNDLRGHATGDEALRHVCDILRGNTRGNDILARVGGDEFVIWLENVDENQAIKRAKTFIAAASSLLAYSGSADQPLQLSIGVAYHDPQREETASGLLERADAAMYRAKQAHKGAFAVAPPPEVKG